MDKALSWEPTPEEAAQFQAQVNVYFTEMDNLQQKMARDQNRIELLRVETRALLTSIQKTLAQMEAA